MRPGRGLRSSAPALCNFWQRGRAQGRGRGAEPVSLPGAARCSARTLCLGVSFGGRKVPNILVQLPVVNWAARLGRLALCGMALRGTAWHSMLPRMPLVHGDKPDIRTLPPAHAEPGWGASPTPQQ